MKTPVVEVQGLRVEKGGRSILSIDRLVVEEGEVMGLVGPNGAGKTTLLMVVAGLDMGFRGRVLIRGVPLEAGNLLSHRRRLGMVFQDPQVLDLTVLANVAAPLRYRGVPGREARRRAMAWLDRLGIAGLAAHPARTLSGGERQRLALARALVTEPELLLLDEPFSSLDAPTRAGLIADLRQLLAALGVTAIVVSHDFTEVLLLARRAVVLMGGRIRQDGEPRSVFWHPADPEVARLVGMDNVWTGEVVSGPRGSRVRLGEWELDLPCPHPGGPVQVGVRPEAVTLCPDGRGLPAEVKAVVPHGPLILVEFGGPLPLVALVPAAQGLELAPGARVTVDIPPASLHLFPAASPPPRR
ncbi:MAG: ABC transporter ATP-binding protein [Bacillota bacterium]|nr:ABC transporter ATP-binding protein [Bacillota bacterium]